MIALMLAAAVAATPAPEPPAFTPRNPWLAATMGTVPALALTFVNLNSPGPLVYLGVPAVLGAGQLYNGDPWKAAGIGIATYPVALTGFGVGFFTAIFVPYGSTLNPFRTMEWGAKGMMLALGGYVGYVALDGFFGALVVNHEHGLP